MKSTARGMRRGLAAALAASAVIFGLTAFTPQAGAAQDGDEADRTMNHTMGSQIREHEGDSTSGAAVAAADIGVEATVTGIDVASYQGNVNWASHWSAGKKFAYVKATEGLTYKNPYFSQQYSGSYGVGMIRGSYHFALPDKSTGAQQANYFASNGGGWSKDGKTLPGVADLEYNPYGATCYGKTQASMAAWIRDFATTYKSRTGRDAVFYTSTSWWSQCVGSAQAFAGTNPLWVARYSSAVGTLPYNWGVWTFWQYTSTPLDTDYFNGAMDRLVAMANG